MMFLSLAFVFAGMNKSFGQVDPNTNDPAVLGGAGECVPAVPLGCVTDAGPLNPIPGKTYTYAVEDVGATSVASVQWFVYDATATTGNGPNIIVDGSIATAATNMETEGSSLFLLSAEDHYGAMTAIDAVDGGGDPINPLEIDISWQSFDGETNEILLVAYVEGADGCSDNIEVYRIEPAFSFTLDIASLMPGGSLNATRDGENNPLVISDAEECVDPVWSATFTPGATDYLTMDYGANYVFFTVNAANFVHSWQPTFSATHNGTPASTITEIAWAYDGTSTTAADWHVADGTTGIAAAVEIQAEDVDAVGAEGECIVVRVLVEHGAVENDVASTVTLEVDGIMYDAAADTEAARYANGTLADLDEPEGTGACVNDVTDSAIYNLNPRPEVTTDTEPGATTPEPFIDKN